MSVTEHKQAAPSFVRCKVITVSDTRTKETDTSGQLMMELLKTGNHLILAYEIVTDDSDMIRQAILNGYTNEEVDVILLNGGTGMSPRDVTIETVKALLDKEMVGFGEIFRMLSYTEDIGSAAILSRAIAGSKGKTVIFSTPGSTGAVRLAMNKLILPEINHAVREVNR